MGQINIFGQADDPFLTAKEKYGTWPVTVMEIDMGDPFVQALKRGIGDEGRVEAGVQSDNSRRLNTTRGESFSHVSPHSCYRVASSTFNPILGTLILNLYSPKQGRCFDPFGGGGTRGILAAKHGLEYTGLEIRPDEVFAVQERFRLNNVKAEILLADACDCNDLFLDNTFDFLLTCPPYWTLEQYNGGVKDLSMLGDYPTFQARLFNCIKTTKRILKPGAFSCWVVGLTRDKDGALVPLHHDISSMHRQLGFQMCEEIIVHVKNSGAIQRVGNFEKGNRHLVRVHEYVLVFRV